MFRGMIGNAGTEGVTGAEWAMREPLIEAARPRGETPPNGLRRRIGATS